MKRLLYAVLGLFLLGTPVLGQQTIQKAQKAEFEFGVSQRAGASAYPTKEGWSTYLSPITADTTWTFYYDVKGKRIIRDFRAFVQDLINRSPGGGGGPGIVYLPGKGLSLGEGNRFSIVQADQGSLGNIQADRLIWNSQNMPSLVTAEGLSLSNGEFLMNLGTTTVRMGIQDYRLFLQKALGITAGGGGSGITWVDRPDTHTSPGKIGYASIWQDKLFVYGRETGQTLTQWFMLDGVVKNFSFDPLSQEGAPTATGTFDAS
ncbi:hypothetical protein BWI93_16505, partial [Siphonobacter sp. BAB-5385]|uniref:hypothetical protein n=1 Tax=Siphonobacter sp. BAB-5385 TaxID=1864822 RepID=UPI000BD5A6FC